MVAAECADVTALAATGPAEVLVAAHARCERARVVGYFGRWQGKAFAKQAAPFDGIVNRLWFDEPDVLWATDLDDQLWRSHSGTWTRVLWAKPDPDNNEITQVWQRGPNDIWIAVQSRSGNTSAVYHGHADPTQ